MHFVHDCFMSTIGSLGSIDKKLLSRLADFGCYRGGGGGVNLLKKKICDENLFYG